MATAQKASEADRLRFAGLVSILAATFGKEADEAMIEGYWYALDDLPIHAVERSVRTAIKSCKFMPSGRELREFAGVMSPDARAVQAWEQLEKAIALHGYYSSINFDDPVINAAVRNMGGWEQVCSREGDDASKWLRKDFERVYVALLSSGISREQAAPLIGYSERQNRLLGYVQDSTLLLADGSKTDLPRIEFATGLPEHLDKRLRIEGRPHKSNNLSRADLPRVEFKRANPPPHP